MNFIVIAALRCSLLMALLCAAMPLLAKPKCEADTFTGKKGCAYETGTIGLAGLGKRAGKFFASSSRTSRPTSRSC